MPAPSPDSIVTDPAPLNPTAFPFAVQPFPAQQFADFDGILHRVARGGEAEPSANPLRLE